MNQTQNLQLPQWEAADRVTRADINGAFAVLDGALRAASGTFTGTGGFGRLNPSSLTLPFVPKLLMIGGTSGTMFTLYSPLLDRRSYSPGSYTLDNLTVSDDGRTLSWYYGSSERAQYNESGVTYYWLVIG